MNPIIVALDFETISEARALARSVGPYVGAFKIGLELIWAEGPRSIEEIGAEGLPVFVDAKLHDIPNTVGRAARQLGRLGARWVTVHATGGAEMLRAAVEGFGESAINGGVLAVTLLTSLGEAQLETVGFAGSTGETVASLARLAAATGVEGVVCSAREVAAVKERVPGLLRVTPGIRPGGHGDDDQVRVATPAAAIAAGADLIVIGRAITHSSDPAAVASSIAEEVGWDAQRRSAWLSSADRHRE